MAGCDPHQPFEYATFLLRPFDCRQSILKLPQPCGVSLKPLPFACFLGNVELVELLLKYGVSSSWRYLFLCACGSRNLAVLRLVVELMDDPKQFADAFLFSCCVQSAPLVDMLLARASGLCDVPAYLNQKNVAGQTSLFAALAVRHSSAPLKLRDSESCGETSFDKICFDKHFLSQWSGDINTQDTLTGDTVLHLACQAGNLRTVELLLQRGAKTDICNNDGEVAIFCSIKKCATTKVFSFSHPTAAVNKTNCFIPPVSAGVKSLDSTLVVLPLVHLPEGECI